jgi:hypothetical protein
MKKNMPPLLKTLLNSIQEDFGRPASIHALIDAHPSLSIPLREPARSIASSSVARWHEWGETSFNHWPHRNRGEVMGWRYASGAYSSFCVKREEFVNFGSCAITEGWECDIQDVTGLAASKSELKDFDTLDRMVETNSRKMIESITAEKLRENLAWGEIRILHRDDPSDFFARYLWDDRVFLINSGGSHHFAAARYIAARIGSPVLLRGKLRTYAINEMAVVSLQRDYEMFVIADTPNAALGFHDAMQRFRASYLWQYLPRPYLDCRAILLPKADARSMKVATALHQARFFDLGLYLRGLVARQANTQPSDSLL